MKYTCRYTCVWIYPHRLRKCCHMEEVVAHGYDIIPYGPSVLWLKILTGAQIKNFLICTNVPIRSSWASFVSSSIDPAVSTCFVVTLKAEGCYSDSAVSWEPVLDWWIRGKWLQHWEGELLLMVHTPALPSGAERTAVKLICSVGNSREWLEWPL